MAAVATRRPKRWADLIAFARKSGGKLLVPVLGDQAAASDEAKYCLKELVLLPQQASRITNTTVPDA